MAKLTPDQRALFEGRNFVTVATVGKDGAPHATPVWVEIDDQDRVVVNSALGRGWPSNLKRDPRVALSIFDQENPYHKLSLTGRVVEMTTDGARDHIEKLAHKYHGRPFGGPPDETRVLIRIELDDSAHEMGSRR